MARRRGTGPGASGFIGGEGRRGVEEGEEERRREESAARTAAMAAADSGRSPARGRWRRGRGLGRGLAWELGRPSSAEGI